MQVFLDAVSLGAFYCLMALGLSLILGVMKVLNFAHGALIMAGGFVAWLVISSGVNLPLPLLLFLAIVASMAAVAGLSIAIERGMFRRLRANPMAAFMVSLGLVYIIEVSFLKIFGILPKAFPSVFPGQIELLGGSLSTERAIVLFVSITLVVLFWFFLQRTKLGRGLRCVAQDSEAATLQGMGINRHSAIAMGIGGAFAAIAGVVAARFVFLTPYLGMSVIWMAFIIVIVGGGGSIAGTIVASYLFGGLNSGLTALGEPQLIIMVDVLVMLAVLAVRPQGLLGRER